MERFSRGTRKTLSALDDLFSEKYMDYDASSAGSEEYEERSIEEKPVVVVKSPPKAVVPPIAAEQKLSKSARRRLRAKKKAETTTAAEEDNTPSHADVVAAAEAGEDKLVRDLRRALNCLSEINVKDVSEKVADCFNESSLSPVRCASALSKAISTYYACDTGPLSGFLPSIAMMVTFLDFLLPKYFSGTTMCVDALKLHDKVMKRLSNGQDAESVTVLKNLTLLLACCTSFGVLPLRTAEEFASGLASPLHAHALSFDLLFSFIRESAQKLKCASPETVPRLLAIAEATATREHARLLALLPEGERLALLEESQEQQRRRLLPVKFRFLLLTLQDVRDGRYVANCEERPTMKTLHSALAEASKRTTPCFASQNRALMLPLPEYLRVLASLYSDDARDDRKAAQASSAPLLYTPYDKCLHFLKQSASASEALSLITDAHIVEKGVACREVANACLDFALAAMDAERPLPRFAMGATVFGALTTGSTLREPLRAACRAAIRDLLKTNHNAKNKKRLGRVIGELLACGAVDSVLCDDLLDDTVIASIALLRACQHAPFVNEYVLPMVRHRHRDRLGEFLNTLAVRLAGDKSAKATKLALRYAQCAEVSSLPTVISAMRRVALRCAKQSLR